MRLRTFTADNMTQAIARVRDELGPDAVIVSSRPGIRPNEVVVTSAVDCDPAPRSLPAAADWASGEEPMDLVARMLEYHRVPGPITDRVLSCASVLETTDPVRLTAGAFDMCLGFSPLDIGRSAGPLVMVGPPGSGKTIAAAKLAAAARLMGKGVHLMSTDTERAGAAERLEALAERIGLPVNRVAEPYEAAAHLSAATAETVIVDTPGINPFEDGELDRLHPLAALDQAEICLVLAAGGDALESAETAIAFQGAGARRLIATRLDTARRYGGLLSAAHEARLPLGASGIRPEIAEGLSPLNPMSLARLFALRALSEETSTTPMQSEALV